MMLNFGIRFPCWRLEFYVEIKADLFFGIERNLQLYALNFMRFVSMKFKFVIFFVRKRKGTDNFKRNEIVVHLTVVCVNYNVNALCKEIKTFHTFGLFIRSEIIFMQINVLCLLLPKAINKHRTWFSIQMPWKVTQVPGWHKCTQTMNILKTCLVTYQMKQNKDFYHLH